jgi:hypothetical protein
MKHPFRFFLTALLLLTEGAVAQMSLPVPTNIQKAYDKGTRNTDGLPGARYWQNTADYDIQVAFSPETRLVSGRENIVYANNSPDTLKTIWFKLYPNFYKKGSPRNGSIRPQDVTAGVQIQQLVVNGITKDAGGAQISGTNMTLPVSPLLPHDTTRFTIRWSYVLNKTSHVRTGEVEEGSYFIAYFFPRIAVYDDIDGWNRYPYNGLQEFYNDFCDFKVAVTVPKNYVVWATGTLEDAADVLHDKYVRRIDEAEMSDAVTTIIDTSDLKNGGITADHSTNTWTFNANNVTEFAFATSDHYVWKSASLIVDSATGRRTRADAVFDPKHKDYEEIVNFARKTVHAMSDAFPAWPYPYPHETIYDGLDQMEYPMMVNDNPLKDRAAAIELTDHEIFHSMFPFYMGTNETKYAFMDEGWATIGEWVISPLIDEGLVDHYGMPRYNDLAGSEADLPIMTLSTEQTGVSYYLNSYPKPALGYLYVRDMLGDKLFTLALHHYITVWHGKHPMPLDFFQCMNKGSGVNLNWFWRKWFYDRGYADLGIERVTRKSKGYKVVILSKGNKPTPIDLIFTFADGTSQKLHRSVAAWKEGNRSVTISLKTGKKLKTVTLGGTYDADRDTHDNHYELN